MKVIVLILLILIVTIQDIEYRSIPVGGGNGWEQVVILHCKEGKIKYPDCMIEQEFIPLGKVKIKKFHKLYIGTRVSIKKEKE